MLYDLYWCDKHMINKKKCCAGAEPIGTLEEVDSKTQTD